MCNISEMLVEEGRLEARTKVIRNLKAAIFSDDFIAQVLQIPVADIAAIAKP